MKHKDKLTMARRMRTKQEIKDGVSPLLSKAWNERRDNNETRIRNIQVQAEYRRAAKQHEKR